MRLLTEEPKNGNKKDAVSDLLDFQEDETLSIAQPVRISAVVVSTERAADLDIDD